MLANELGLIYGCKTRIIPYVLTWDGIVTKYHAKYKKALEISDRIEAYIQSVTLKNFRECVDGVKKRRRFNISREREERKYTYQVNSFDTEAEKIIEL